MRPRIPARSLAEISLPEESFRADFEITDKYQAFSAELVRLSLLGIVGYGFLLSNLALKNGARSDFFAQVNAHRLLLGLGVLFLGVATAFALAHRFFSTDCLSHQVTILRLLKRVDRGGGPGGVAGETEELKDDEARLEQERRSQHADLRWCRYSLICSSFFLACGAAAVAITFALVLFTGDDSCVPVSLAMP